MQYELCLYIKKFESSPSLSGKTVCTHFDVPQYPTVPNSKSPSPRRSHDKSPTLMGIATTSAAAVADGDSESATLLIPKTSSTNPQKIPKDNFNMAYIIYFTLGAGYLLPWNAFITAVDYFSYIYPDVSVDRVFAIVYMLIGLMSLLFIVAFAHRSNSFVRINVGMVLFVIALLTVPLMDVWYIKGRVGVYVGYYVTVAVLGLCGVADGLVQGSVVGNAGELPERYMQAVVAGTAASGKFYVFLVFLEIIFLVLSFLVLCGLL